MQRHMTSASVVIILTRTIVQDSLFEARNYWFVETSFSHAHASCNSGCDNVACTSPPLVVPKPKLDPATRHTSHQHKFGEVFVTGRKLTRQKMRNLMG